MVTCTGTMRKYLHALVIRVSRRRLLCQHRGGVEDIQALVLHGTHVEIIDLRTPREEEERVPRKRKDRRGANGTEGVV